MKKEIIEKQLGITGDYQYQALHHGNFLQANWHQNKLLVLSKILKKYAPKTLLDLGTGSGNFEILFADQLEKIVGVDYNNEALVFLGTKLKQKDIKNVKLVCQNILNIDAKMGKFDMIIMVDVLEHLESSSCDKLVANFKKLLNPKGKVVIVTPNYKGFWPLIENLIIDKFTSLPHLENLQHITKFHATNLEEVFQKQGFKLLKLNTFNTYSFLFPQPFSSWLCRLELSLTLPFGNLLTAVFEPS